jgi:pimeloyl-ACP methyl ester carboxylesterase
MLLSEGRLRRARFVSSGGERIYAEVTGEGDAVVLCHGLGGNHAIWWRQLDAFARRHTVVTWDQRGFGNSTAATGATGIDEAATDLLAVLDELDVGRVHVVGQSMGAFVALRFALRHPARTRSLVLSTTLAAADPALSAGLLAAVPARQLRDRHPVLSERFAEREPSLAVLYNQISSFGAKPPTARMLEAMVAQVFTDAELAALDCPVLSIAAEFDELCSPEVMRVAAARLPAARFAVIDGVAHSAYYEQPDAWNRPVLDFLAIA